MKPMSLPSRLSVSFLKPGAAEGTTERGEITLDFYGFSCRSPGILELGVGEYRFQMSRELAQQFVDQVSDWIESGCGLGMDVN